MPDVNYGHPTPVYKAALIVESRIPNLPKERKAAILAELEALGNVSTADENRAGVETAGVAQADPSAGRHADVAPAESGR